MRRQAADGRTAPAGSSRDERLDPFSLRMRFEASDPSADARVRSIELTRERVVVRRTVRGMLMVVRLPVASYLGVALRMDAAAGAVAVVLEHSDSALSLPLHRAQDGAEVVAEWQSWARVLRLPLLIAEPDGRLREPCRRIGGLHLGAVVARRRRRCVLPARRPSSFLRRRPGRALKGAAVHRGEREIIARN